ncbi:Pumilio-like protein 2 [Frankliniella fusca]|uniref:Pumilio-like protein 2 n=1 Tax=Frankliniella fusca TaxID=407009 RepID=A0AAE1GWW3_9NEOP|nr:Pumilio-like protein 2 [Frankliniella fusca]
MSENISPPIGAQRAVGLLPWAAGNPSGTAERRAETRWVYLGAAQCRHLPISTLVSHLSPLTLAEHLNINSTKAILKWGELW